MKFRILTILLFIGLISCKNEVEQANNTVNTTASNTVNTESTTASVTQQRIVEYYQNKNGIPIYNGFIDADTANVAAGNKYIIDVVAYELWGKFLYLNSKYEVTATDKPEEITASDLGAFHPYLVRVSIMPKPYSIQNAQEIEVKFSDMGIPSIHRTDFLKARSEGWDMQLSTKQNFAACTENDLRCNAERVLETVVGNMFR